MRPAPDRCGPQLLAGLFGGNLPSAGSAHQHHEIRLHRSVMLVTIDSGAEPAALRSRHLKREIQTSEEKSPPARGGGLFRWVGRPGLEPGTLGLRGPCSDQLSYDPILNSRKVLNLRSTNCTPRPFSTDALFMSTCPERRFHHSPLFRGVIKFNLDLHD